MKKRHIASTGLLVLSALIASCGGGGGGGGGGGFPGFAPPPANTPPPNNAAGAWLTFNPSPVELTLFPNTAKSFIVTATSTRVISAPVNVAVLDAKGVITTDVKIASSGLKYTTTLNTNPALAPGVYTGNFEVRVCYDINPLICTQPVEGSPWQLPYKITVLDPASMHFSRWESVQATTGFDFDFALSQVGGKPFVVARRTISTGMDTYTSPDIGNSWTRLTTTTALTPTTRNFALASDNTAIYLSGGQTIGGTYQNHVWKFDGIDWLQKTAAAEFPGRESHVMAKVGTALYVVAGRTAAGDVNNVWKSDNDGINWTQVSAGLPAALGKPTCALNWRGSLLLVGDKVATSTDGVSFTVASSVPPTFPKGSVHCAVLNDRLFISPTTGASVGSTEQNVMSTTDLVNWQLERTRPVTTGDVPGMAVIDGRLVVITRGVGIAQQTISRTVP